MVNRGQVVAAIVTPVVSQSQVAQPDRNATSISCSSYPEINTGGAKYVKEPLVVPRQGSFSRKRPPESMKMGDRRSRRVAS